MCVRCFLELVDEGLRFVTGELSGGLSLVEPQRSTGVAEAVVAGGLEVARPARAPASPMPADPMPDRMPSPTIAHIEVRQRHGRPVFGGRGSVDVRVVDRDSLDDLRGCR